MEGMDGCEYLVDEVDEIQELMSSKKVYEDRGRGYAKSALLCHRVQRAAKNSARKSTGAAPFITQHMAQMVNKSQRMHEPKPSKTKKARKS